MIFIVSVFVFLAGITGFVGSSQGAAEDGSQEEIPIDVDGFEESLEEDSIAFRVRGRRRGVGREDSIAARVRERRRHRVDPGRPKEEGTTTKWKTFVSLFTGEYIYRRMGWRW